jgi:hypothetical protein
MVTISRCPRDHNIFPALQVERGVRDLFADFKAFRFPSTATVNFVATVQFCQDVCEPVSKEMISVHGIMYVILVNTY